MNEREGATQSKGSKQGGGAHGGALQDAVLAAAALARAQDLRQLLQRRPRGLARRHLVLLPI